ncbi:hypothetical protein HAX54_019936 [Datura stramonium]|uniref:Uncharacterized protein n=1 Tax=Datura stramonium TaxID=4076 RepID=A0ABS8US29_DATST|nr:hypothetical protein [Datura stramonium]
MAQESSSTPSTEGNQNPDNLILDTPVSSNPSSPSGTDIRNSPGSKMPTISCAPGNPSKITTPTTQEDDKTVDQEIGVVDGGRVTTKDVVEGHTKQGSDLSNETLFEGGLIESKEGTSNILQNEAEIIERFMTALETRAGEIGEKTPSAEGGRSDTGNEEGPFVQESREQSSQEAPTVTVSPKWDGTPTPPEVGINDARIPLAPAEDSSPTPND